MSIVEKAQDVLTRAWVSHVGNKMSSEDLDIIKSQIAGIVENPTDILRGHLLPFAILISAIAHEIDAMTTPPTESE